MGILFLIICHTMQLIFNNIHLTLLNKFTWSLPHLLIRYLKDLTENAPSSSPPFLYHLSYPFVNSKLTNKLTITKSCVASHPLLNRLDHSMTSQSLFISNTYKYLSNLNQHTKCPSKKYILSLMPTTLSMKVKYTYPLTPYWLEKYWTKHRL